MARSIIMGIDVGTSAVKAIIAEKIKGEEIPQILGSGISPCDGLRRGIVINQHDVAAAIKNAVKQACKEAGLNIKQAFVSIGGASMDGVRSRGSIVVSRADHEITENDLNRAINQSKSQLSRNSTSYLLNREVLHHSPISFKVDEEQIIGTPIGMKGEKLEVETLLVTILAQHLNSLIKSFDLAGITVEDVTSDSWATGHAILNKKEREVGCSLVNIGADTSSLIVFEEGEPISLEVFPIGSNHITYDIARGFQILLDKAEQLKISYGSDPSTKKKLNTIIEPRLSDIFELVENHLHKIKRSQLLPAGVILTGGGSNLAGVEEIAKNSLKLPARTSQSFIPKGFKESLNDPIWIVAWGLCLMACGEKSDLYGSQNRVFSKIKRPILNLLKNFLP